MEFHPLADIFPMMSAEEYVALRDDIAQYGLREPITLAEGKIADGRNRYNACLELGIEPKYEEWDGVGSLLAFIVSMNLHRRHLDESQRAMVAAKIANMPAHRPENKSANLQTSQDDAANLVNVSTRSVASAKKVLTEGTPELAQAVEQGKVAVSLAAKVAGWPEERQADFVDAVVEEGHKPSKVVYQIRKQEAAAKAKMSPPGIFNVILADPPWEYHNVIAKWGPADMHYPTMPLDDVCNLLKSIGLNVADNAVLFLWTTNPQLGDAFKVIQAWGFVYKTNIVWIKTELKKPGSGWYVRGRHELCLICTKGSFTPLDEHISPPIGSVITAPVGKHSEKPQELYGIIEKLYPNCAYIELFATSEREDWKAWGTL